MLGRNPQVNEPLTTAFAYLLLPQVLAYGLTSVFMAILNTRNVFGPPAWAPVVNNVVALATLGVYLAVPGELSVDPVRMGNTKLLVLGIGTTFGVFAQAAVLLVALRRERISLRPLWGIDERLKRFGAMAAAMVLYVLISQIGLVVGNQIASTAAASGPAIYNYTWLVLMLPFGMIGVTVLTVVMPRLSRNAADDDTRGVLADLSLATRLTLVTLIPIVAFMTVGGPAIGTALFAYGHFGQVDAGYLGAAIALSAFTLIPYGLVLLQLRVFYAREQPWTPIVIILVITAVKIAGSLLVPAPDRGPRAGRRAAGPGQRRRVPGRRDRRLRPVAPRPAAGRRPPGRRAGGAERLGHGRRVVAGRSGCPRGRSAAGVAGTHRAWRRCGFAAATSPAGRHHAADHGRGHGPRAGPRSARGTGRRHGRDRAPRPPGGACKKAGAKGGAIAGAYQSSERGPVTYPEHRNSSLPGVNAVQEPIRRRPPERVASVRIAKGPEVTDRPMESAAPSSASGAELPHPVADDFQPDIPSPGVSARPDLLAENTRGPIPFDAPRERSPEPPASSDDAHLVPGARIAGGRYRLLVFHGGPPPLQFWQALDTALDRQVALTFVDPDGALPGRRPAGDLGPHTAAQPDRQARHRPGARRRPHRIRGLGGRGVDSWRFAAGGGRHRAVARRRHPGNAVAGRRRRRGPPRRRRPIDRPPQPGARQHRRRRCARLPGDHARRQPPGRHPRNRCRAVRPAGQPVAAARVRGAQRARVRRAGCFGPAGRTHRRRPRHPLPDFRGRRPSGSGGRRDTQCVNAFEPAAAGDSGGRPHRGARPDRRHATARLGAPARSLGTLACSAAGGAAC